MQAEGRALEVEGAACAKREALGGEAACGGELRGQVGLEAGQEALGDLP